MPTYLILFIGHLLAVGNLEFCNLRLLLAGRPFHITWQTDFQKTNAQLAETQKKRNDALALLDIEKAKADSDKCAPCIASLNEQLASYDALIVQLEAQAADLFCRIENRVKHYDIQMQERVRFGEQVQSMNDAWSRFNNSLDELQRTLSKINCYCVC
jgi:hypothetical protein